MPIYRPTELQEFLSSLGVTPKKVLSQNFLIDGNIVQKILACATVTRGDIVLEIGPGPGVLTEALINKGVHVIAIERDDKLADALKRFCNTDVKLHIYAEDAMTFDYEGVLTPLLAPGQKVKVIANLPYHLTSAIVAKLVVMEPIIASLTLMVQDEVGRRFAAKAKEKDYSSFSLFLQLHAAVKYAFTVSANCFYPAPKVASAVVHLDLKPLPEIGDIEAFFKMTRTTFQQRRKMMRSSLRELYTPADVERALIAIGLSHESRPEELSGTQFLALFKQLSH